MSALYPSAYIQFSPCRCGSRSQWVGLDGIFNLKEQMGKNRIETIQTARSGVVMGTQVIVSFHSWLNN